MKCINFDHQFELYAAEWMKKNAEKYKNNMDVIEMMMPDVYMEFLSKPAQWLGGKTPERYFAQYKDAKMLVDLMCQYEAEKVPVPDLLLERITELGKKSEPCLIALLTKEDVPDAAVMTAISLLREIESTAPMNQYIDFIASLTEADEKGDMCAESLQYMGSEVVAPILDALKRSGDVGREIFADILCNYPGDDRIFDLLIRLFVTQSEKKALFASYLAKLGDDRALEVLNEAAAARDINYLDFVEISSAIEALGGDRPAEREFSGDPYYESLKRA